MPVKTDLRSLSWQTLADLVRAMGAETYRAGQIAQWIWQKGAESIDEMTDLSQTMRSQLKELAEFPRIEFKDKQISQNGDTAKYLFAFTDGETVESVLMRHSYGFSACVSTQAGCRMGCRLCASGLAGLARNLSAGEIYAQVLGMQKDSGVRVSHVVVMGSGEPLDNYDNTLVFLKNITASYGLNIGWRHITLSTCGLVPRIKQLAGERLSLTLAVSLHAPNDSLRDQLLPVNKRYPLHTLLGACREYAAIAGRRITFEYALIGGVNDHPRFAIELSKLISGMPCHVNLIAVNHVPEHGIRPPSRRRADVFKHTLEKQGVPVTVRRSLGGDIAAACGQLRNRFNRGSD